MKKRQVKRRSKTQRAQPKYPLKTTPRHAVRNSQPQGKHSKSTGSIRLIAGQWRGRKLPVLTLAGLRPTSDRVRETLFNWLQGDLYQAQCLDLFAGSGALGFEAISRGAAQLVMVEKHRAAAQQLAANIRLLNSNKIHLVQEDAYHYLASSRETFDLIFLDPPFHQGHMVKLIQKIMATNRLAPKGLMYVEYESEMSLDLTPWNLRILKHTQAGQSQAFLLTRADESI